MKNKPHQAAIISNPTPLILSDHYSDYLLFFLENRCEMSTLKQHFSLSSKQVLEFLTSREVREMLEALQESVRLAFAVGAQKSRDFAIATMKTVCVDLIRQTCIPVSGIVNETVHAKAVNNIRMATAQLGRLAAATIAPPKQVRQQILPSELQHLVPPSESESAQPDLNQAPAPSLHPRSNFDTSPAWHNGSSLSHAAKT